MAFCNYFIHNYLHGGISMKSIICFALCIGMLAATGVYSSTPVSFKGIIININESSIEIKKGKKELTLFWTDTSKVMMEGKETDRSAVDICQLAEARYAVKDQKRELVELVILKKSYCTK